MKTPVLVVCLLYCWNVLLADNQPVDVMKADTLPITELTLAYYPARFPPRQALKTAELPPLHQTHPYQWLRGQLPGLIVSQAGNDPWEQPTMRQQGVHSLSQRADPLWVVDGMPAIDPLLLETGSVEQIRLLRRPVDLVQYGLQASAGVLEVTTQQAATAKLLVTYAGQLSHERAIRLPRVASAIEYRNNPGGFLDFGFSTDWQRSVTRTALSHRHQLAISRQRKNTTWRAEGAFRDVQGVGRNSQWTQYSGRLFWKQQLWKERVQLQLQAAGQRRKGSKDYQQTFFYASKYNPTAPIRFEEVPDNPLLSDFFTTSSLLLRNYFEASPSLDFFNPIAIQAGSLLEEQTANRWLQAQAIWRISAVFQVYLKAGYQANDREQGEENRTYAFFRGNALSNLPGAAQRQKDQSRQEWLKSYLDYAFPIMGGTLTVDGGYQYQHYRIDNRQSQARGFGTDDFSFKNFELALTPMSNFSQDTYSEGHRLIGFFANTNYLKSWLNWRTSFQRQGATRLGKNQSWASQFGTDIEIRMNALSKTYHAIKTVLHGGYAKIGGLPTDKNYSLGPFDPIQQAFVNANPNLMPETRRLGQVGIRWEHYRWFASVDYTGSKTFDPIVQTFLNNTTTGFSQFGDNLSQLALRNRAWEFSLGFQRQLKSVQWISRLRWAYTRTYLEQTEQVGAANFFDSNGQAITNASSPGGFSSARGIGLLELDGPFGQIIGPQLDEQGSLAAGRPVFYDTFFGQNLPAPLTNIGVIGNGLPTHTYAWENQFRWNNWRVDLLLRGELGHDLAHLRREELDPITSNLNIFPASRNYLSTRFDLEGVKGFVRFSDYYIEAADYLSLDYLSISHTFSVKNKETCQISLSVQNLLLLTRYTGVDPSPRYVDRGIDFNDIGPTLPSRSGQLAPGIDRRYFYPRTRTITLGVRLGL